MAGGVRGFFGDAAVWREIVVKVVGMRWCSGIVEPDFPFSLGRRGDWPREVKCNLIIL